MTSTEQFGGQPWEWQGQEELRLYAANVTSWSDQTKIFLEHLVEADIVGISEHHLAAAKITSAKKQLSRAGWCSSFAPAIATEREEPHQARRSCGRCTCVASHWR